VLKCRIEAESGRPPSPQINAAGARARALLAARLAKSATPDEIGFGPPDPPRGGGDRLLYLVCCHVAAASSIRQNYEYSWRP
jgi:hypothetical protein